MKRILHIAAENFAGVPYDFMQMHNQYGDYSRLITQYRSGLSFQEDICLDFPVPKSNLAKIWRRKKISDTSKPNIPNLKTSEFYFRPKNLLEQIYFQMSDLLRSGKIAKVINDFALETFDIIHYDGGLDFFRDSRLAKEWKKRGKKIVCCYFGSDLRARGLIKEMNEISDLNITSEFDHLALKSDIHYLFYPYNISELPAKRENNEKKIKIVHSPTNRMFKGTDLIIGVIEKIKKIRDIEFFLLEKMERQRVLEIKSGSDICIDQVGGKLGGTGYGKAGLETLGMGIPTITNMTDDYKNWFPENPFIVANNGDELFERLIELIDSKDYRNKVGEESKKWVTKYHGYEAVNRNLHKLYSESGII